MNKFLISAWTRGRAAARFSVCRRLPALWQGEEWRSSIPENWILRRYVASESGGKVRSRKKKDEFESVNAAKAVESKPVPKRREGKNAASKLESVAGENRTAEASEPEVKAEVKKVAKRGKKTGTDSPKIQEEEASKPLEKKPVKRGKKSEKKLPEGKEATETIEGATKPNSSLNVTPAASQSSAESSIGKTTLQEAPEGSDKGAEKGKAKPADEENDDFQGVDDELIEFLTKRKQRERAAKMKEEVIEQEESELDYEWDYRDLKELPKDVKLLDKRLKQLGKEAPPDDRRTAMVKLKLALELCKNDGPAERAIDLANEAMKVLGIGANDYSVEQGLCLSVLGSGYRKLGQIERSLSYLKRAATYFEEKEEKGQEVVRDRQFVLSELGFTYLTLRQVKKGVEALVDSLDLMEAFTPYDDVTLGDAFRKAAIFLKDVQEWQEAKKMCAKAIRIHSKSKGYENEDVGQDRKIMAEIYRGLNMHEQALEEFRTARRIFQTDQRNLYWANMGIADSQMALGSLSEAIATLEGALGAVPSTPVTLKVGVYLKLAKAFFLKSSKLEARKRLVNALEFYKENLVDGAMEEVASQLHEIAAMFDVMGDLNGSIRTLKLAIAAYDCVPGSESLLANAKMDLGSHLVSHGKAEKALPYYQEAMALSEKSNSVSANLLTLTAIAHMELQDYEAAVGFLEKARESLESPKKQAEAQKKLLVEPGLVKLPVFHHLVRCYRSLERFDEALKCQHLVVTELRIIGGQTEEKRMPDALRLLEELKEKVEKPKATAAQA